MRALLVVVGSLGLASCSPQPAVKADPEVARKGVEAAINTSLEGWKAGQINRFLGIYSDAQDAVFVTDKGLVRGKAAMEQRYREGYAFDDAARRGDLKTQIIDFRSIDADHAVAVVNFMLTPANGPAVSGFSTLVFRKETDGWKVIVDHSS